MSRLHILVDADDKHRYEAQAAREGKSLGAWLREAAAEKYRAARRRAPFEDPAELEAFFEECDAQQDGVEPDWEEHRRVLDSSRRDGLEPT